MGCGPVPPRVNPAVSCESWIAPRSNALIAERSATIRQQFLERCFRQVSYGTLGSIVWNDGREVTTIPGPGVVDERSLGWVVPQLPLQPPGGFAVTANAAEAGDRLPQASTARTR